jgi:membrane protein CcdC involved in cytochrome C biogenesis
MIGGMWMRILLPTAVFTVAIFVGYLLLSSSSVAVDLLKAVVLGLLFGLYQVWSVRRAMRRRGGS